MARQRGSTIGPNFPDGVLYTAPMRRWLWIIGAAAAVLILTAWVELAMGRLPFGPDDKFGWWEGDIWSSEQSQRFADPYSLSHVVHGLLFYALLWTVARRLPVRQRLLIAVILEAGWEILENSPFIIDRYREVTIALGYVGDSVVNSLSDIMMMSAGFLLAARIQVRVSLALMVVAEVGMLLWVRDNLVLNIIMLIHPIAAIKAWQMAGNPLP